MFRTILLPLDGSNLAESAVASTNTLAKAFDARLLLLRVLEKTAQNGCSQPTDPLDWRMCKVEAKSYLDNLVALFHQEGTEAEAMLLDGDPAQHIVKLVSERNIGLVVLSSHGHSGLTSWNHGSVIRKVIARSQSSVMIVRAYREREESGISAFYRRILVPLDGSKRAECVLQPAAALARFCGGQLLLVHVAAPPEMPRLKVPTQEDLQLAARIVERNQEEMEKLLEQLKSRLRVSCETRILSGDHVAATLHEFAREEKIDLVALSAHGYSGKAKWPYGSIASTFIEYGFTPLLIVQDLPPGSVEPTEAETVARERAGH